MKSVGKEYIHEYTIKKSRFICHLNFVNTPEEAKSYIRMIKDTHSDASHNCSAYIVGAIEKVDDDGEPNGTAGLPMLDVLKHHDLNYVVCVVTRYFGGIKLGAGGLIRAYSKSVSEALRTAPVLNIIPGVIYLIKFDYDKTKILDYQLGANDYLVLEKKFAGKVEYTVELPSFRVEEFLELINNIDHTISPEKTEDVFITEPAEKASVS